MKKEKDLKILVSELERCGKVSLLPPATDKQIENFEIENDITLPKWYKKWLKVSDGGELFLPSGVQLYGVANKPVIDVEDDVPSNSYIVIGNLATGDPVLFEKNSEKISIYDHESVKIHKDESFEDFFEFLNNLDKLLND